MKNKLTSLLASALLALALTTAAHAAEKHAAPSDDKKAPAPTPADTAAIAQARATYPLKTCLVSDEGLASMGEAVGYIHRATGQPDRVIFVCCDGCIDDFKAAPAKFLAKLDAAAKAKK